MNELRSRQVTEQISRAHPNYAPAWADAADNFGPEWEIEFSDLLERVFGDDEASTAEAVDGYAAFCTDALRSQIFFERKRHYKLSSQAEVEQAGYFDSSFMFAAYLPGMLMSHYVWPHHHRLLQFFRSVAANLDVQSYADVGVGCGMYSKECATMFPGADGFGYDISPHSLAFTANVVNAFDSTASYTPAVRDVLTGRPPAVDLVICQEVLEHLEDPHAFCRALFDMTKPGGHAYITAAINAGHVDHIYLYRSVEEVLDDVRAAGFDIVASRVELAYEGKPIEITPALGGGLAKRQE